MKQMLTHSFVLDCLEDTGADTFAHFEMLIEEHRLVQEENSGRPSRLKQLVPTVGVFHTPLPLKQVCSMFINAACSCAICVHILLVLTARRELCFLRHRLTSCTIKSIASASASTFKSRSTSCATSSTWRKSWPCVQSR